MALSLTDTLDRFFDATLTAQLDKYGQEPSCTYDPEWPSPCILTEDPVEGSSVRWKPVLQDPTSDMFTRLSEALELEIHPDIVTWYTRCWSDHLQASHPEGELTLLFCWNEEDMERLRANLLGHIMAKQKQRQPLSLFFACTDGDEFMTLNNEDGSIWLERPGKKPLRQLASSLQAFLEQLTPIVE
ncbi:SecY-interacting protein [Marinobacterium lutimaris]|uniref:SecY interacting protein Syd n=1 Tax=Marinobacterium lutimaris TaxID=568106 RepID=A0A1H5U486_9GAMM|nr:SecY-interacting protein [Marinobacterium lutimaris]SEF69846.1 SecY interacting protein Syd [Marinobacterium lutimaris]